MSSFNDAIRDLIRQNKLDITFDVLISFADRNRVVDSGNAFSILQGSYTALQEKISAGLLPDAEATTEINSIRKGLFDQFKDMINGMQFDDELEVKLLEEKKKAYEIAHPVEEIVPIEIPKNADKNDEKPMMREFFSRVSGWVSVLGVVAGISILGVIGMGIFYFKNSNPSNKISSKEQKKIAANVIDSLDKITKADTFTHQALRLIFDEKYAEALKKCDSALVYKTEKPMNWEAFEWAELYNLKAECFLNLGHTIDAEECVKKALAIDPEDKEGYVHSTYAQILADKYGTVGPKFMENFKFALDKKLELWEYMEQKGFIKIKNDPSVIKLIKKYRDSN